MRACKGANPGSAEGAALLQRFFQSRLCACVSCPGSGCSGAAGCGKTTWAVQHAQAHPDRRYVILGASFVLEQMRVCAPEEQIALIHVVLGAKPWCGVDGHHLQGCLSRWCVRRLCRCTRSLTQPLWGRY